MISDAKWTQGKWLVYGATVYALTRDKKGRLVNRFSAQPQSCMQDHEADAGEITANANLIAAAPELYDALCDMLSDRENLSEGTINFAKMALAKARGEEV